MGEIAIGDLKPWAKNARTHSKKQLRQIGESISTFGFTNPVFRIFGLFMDWMLGKTYELGLKNIKALA